MDPKVNGYRVFSNCVFLCRFRCCKENEIEITGTPKCEVLLYFDGFKGNLWLNNVGRSGCGADRAGTTSVQSEALLPFFLQCLNRCVYSNILASFA